MDLEQIRERARFRATRRIGGSVALIERGTRIGVSEYGFPGCVIAGRNSEYLGLARGVWKDRAARGEPRREDEISRDFSLDAGVRPTFRSRGERQ